MNAMNIDALKQLITTLNEHYNLITGPFPFRDTVIIQYTKWVLSHLKTIVEENEDVNQLAVGFEGFLRINWSLGNGTSLSPTTIPDTDIISLLCEVATFVAHEKNKHLDNPETPAVPIQVLMPTIATESIRESLFNDVSEVIGEGYPSFTSETDLRYTLKTHVLGRGGLFLLPVKLLTELDLSPKTQEEALRELQNPYYRYSDDEDKKFEVNADDLYVNAEERSRLFEHSHLTKAVSDTKKEYEMLMSDSSNLLARLLQLCQQLKFNSASGIGSETNAGGGAYPAIINFMEYYRSLDDDAKEQIPEALKDEIGTILRLVTDPSENVNATENLSTCVATRRSALMGHISGHEPLLGSISLSGESKALLIQAAREHFETAKTDLQRAIESNSYSENHDPLGITLRVLDVLAIPFNVTSLADLDVIKALSVSEMSGFLTRPELRRQIIEQLVNLENLVIFIMDLSSEKLNVFLTGVINELSAELISTPNDISALLISLDIEKTRIVCEALKATLQNAIDSPSAMLKIMENLSPLQNKVLCEIIHDHLLQNLRSGDELVILLRGLDPVQRLAVYDVIKNEAPTIIHSGRQYVNILTVIPPEHRLALDSAIAPRLLDLIHSVDDVAAILGELDEEAQMVFFKEIQPRRLDLIHSVDDVGTLLGHLDAEQQVLFFEELAVKWPEIIQSGADYSAALSMVPLDQHMALLNTLKARLPDIIRTVDDLGTILRRMDEEQTMMILEALSIHLPHIVTSFRDLLQILKTFKEPQATIICKIIKDELPTLITSSSELNRILNELSVPQGQMVCENLHAHLPSIIKTKNDLIVLLRDVPQEECAVLYEAMKTTLPGLIQSVDDFTRLPDNISHSICDFLSAQWPNIIKSPLDFINILKKLPQDKATLVSHSMKDHLPQLFKSGEAFISLMTSQYHLDTKQMKIIYQAMKNHWKDIIRSGHDLSKMLPILNRNATLYNIVYDAIKNDLPNFITSGEEYFHVAGSLSAGERESLLNAMKDKWPLIIKSTMSLYFLLHNINEDQSRVILQRFNDQLPLIITTSAEFSFLVDKLSPEQQASIVGSLSDFFPRIIQSTSDFSNVVKHLDIEVIGPIIEALKGVWPNIIKSNDDLAIVLPFLLPAEIQSLYETMKDSLPSMLQSSHDFNTLLKTLSSEHDDATIKATFDLLISHANRPQSTQVTFFSQGKPTDALVSAISSLEPPLIKKMNTALGMHLSDSETPSSTDIMAELDAYSARELPHSLRTS